MMETASKYKPYPEYKESGIEWLEKIPSNWGENKLKFISSVQTSNVDKKTIDGEQAIQLCNYTDVYHNNEISSDIEFMRASATNDQIERFRLIAEDVIITKDSESWSDIAVPAYVPHDFDDVICGYHLAQVRPKITKICGKYLYYSFLTSGINEQFQVAANGITRYGLGKYWIDNSLFYIPSLKEQQAIASFLDRETASIDELIAKKKQLIALLEEKRTALISHAVTKGLNPEVKMKDSGIEWLGEIPEHWEVKRLKFVLKNLEQGWSPQCENRFAESNEWGVLKVGCVNGGIFNEFEHKALPDDLEPRIQYEVKSGDILMSRANTRELLGSSALVGNIRDKLLLCDKLYRLIANHSVISPQFIVHYFASHAARYQFEREATGASSSMQNIGQDTIREMIFIHPSLDEQNEIVNFIKVKCSTINNILEMNRQVIDKLQEYRTALISAAVTGKIDVRNEFETDIYEPECKR